MAQRTPGAGAQNGTARTPSKSSTSTKSTTTTKRDQSARVRKPAVKSRAQYEKDAAEKRRTALELRARRMTYQQIADRLGYANRGVAYAAVKRELKAIPREAAKQLREIELESLDQAERALASRIVQGDLGAIDRMIKIKDMRAKLTGLYEAPVDSGVDEVKGVLAAFIGAVVKLDESGELDEEQELDEETDE